MDNLSILNMNESYYEFIYVILGSLVNLFKTYLQEPWDYRGFCGHLITNFSKI